MKLLILGGSVFLGRATVEAALARGHEVTLFNRGQHNPDLFPGVEKLRGDRDGELDALRGRQWDAVIDTCGYFPRVVRQSARLLSDSVAHYTFISSISVYADFSRPLDENGPLGQMDAQEAEAADKITNENYGPLKVLCEQAVEAALPGRALMIRPGIIVGPHDPSDRFTYWPWRVAQGGDVLVPGNPAQRIEIIDVRDLAEWNVRMIEQNQTGLYNATGPEAALTMSAMLETCRSVTESDARFVYVPGEFVQEPAGKQTAESEKRKSEAQQAEEPQPGQKPAEQKSEAQTAETPTEETVSGVDPNAVNCWWLPDGDPENRYFWEVGCARARMDGLAYRPLADTVRDTLAFAQARPDEWKWRIGLTPEQERALLAAWRASGGLSIAAKERE